MIRTIIGIALAIWVALTFGFFGRLVYEHIKTHHAPALNSKIIRA